MTDPTPLARRTVLIGALGVTAAATAAPVARATPSFLEYPKSPGSVVYDITTTVPPDDASTVFFPYPPGHKWSDYLGATDHSISSQQVSSLRAEQGDFTLAFEITGISVTLRDEQTFLAGTRLWLYLAPGTDKARLDALFEQIETKKPLGLSPITFGAVGNGIVDDTLALQAFLAAFDAARDLQPIQARIPAGHYCISQPLVSNCKTEHRATLDLDGVEFVVSWNRVGQEAALTFGDPDLPGTGQGSLDINGRCIFSRGPACSYPPKGLRVIGMAQTNLRGFNGGNWSNTILDLQGVQNVTVEDCIFYSGGYSFPYAETGSSLFRQTGSTLTRISGTFEFPTTCVGKTVEISGGTVPRKDRIVARLSSTQVMMERSFNDTVNRAVAFGSPAPTTTAGSSVVELDGPVTAEMSGLFVGIPRAGEGGKTLWGHILSVNVSTSTITLDRATAISLTPAMQPIDETSEIACPAVSIRSDLASGGGAFENGISQVWFTNLQIESYRGVALGVDDAEFVHLGPAKLHGISTPTGSIYSVSSIWANRMGGVFSGVLDQRSMGRWKMIFADQTWPFVFSSLQARMRSGELLLRVQPYAEGYKGAQVQFGMVHLSGTAAEATWDDLVEDANPQPTPGVVPPLTVLRLEHRSQEHHMGPEVSANEAGMLSARGLYLLPKPEPLTGANIDFSDGTAGANGFGASGPGLYINTGVMWVKV